MFHKIDYTNIDQKLQPIDWDQFFSTMTDVTSTSMTDFYNDTIKTLLINMPLCVLYYIIYIY